METTEPTRITVEETMRTVREVAIQRAAGNAAVAQEVQISDAFDADWDYHVTDYGQ